VFDLLCISQFLLVFRKAAAGELPEDSGLCRLAALTDIDVGQVGVNGAANFFESKVRV
jgi:hypothetical protein